MKRYQSLDSLRGLAALTVVFQHSVPYWAWGAAAAAVPPLQLLQAGRQSVILFFVLSGFVLSLPFWKGTAPTPGRFALKRAARLWPLYAVVVFLSAGWAVLLSGHGLTSPGRVLVEYLPMVGPYRGDVIDGPIWSLIHEMRISLVFPLLMAGLAYQRPIVPLAVIAALGAVGLIAPPPFDSLAYLPMFAAGAVLAKHREQLLSAYRGWLRIAVPAVCLLVFSHQPPEIAGPTGWDFLLGEASVGLIVVALAEPRVQPLLRWRPVAALGTASYSLYLVHGLVLFPAFYAFARVPLPVLLPACWALIALLTWAAYRWIERPSLALSHLLDAPRSARVETPLALSR